MHNHPQKEIPLRGPRGLIRNVYRVTPQLWGGEYPGDRLNPTHLHPRLQLLLSYGVNAFIDLTEVNERWNRGFIRQIDTNMPHGHVQTFTNGRHQYVLAPYSQLLPGGVEYHRYPIRDIDIPSSVTYARLILRTISEWIKEDRRVYVHCRGGIGRTGTIIGCWLADLYKDGNMALHQLDKARYDCFTTFSPETLRQVKYVREWFKAPVQSTMDFEEDWDALDNLLGNTPYEDMSDNDGLDDGQEVAE